MSDNSHIPGVGKKVQKAWAVYDQDMPADGYLFQNKDQLRRRGWDDDKAEPVAVVPWDVWTLLDEAMKADSDAYMAVCVDAAKLALLSEKLKGGA